LIGALAEFERALIRLATESGGCGP
jgi:hypothetical protein